MTPDICVFIRVITKYLGISRLAKHCWLSETTVSKSLQKTGLENSIRSTPELARQFVTGQWYSRPLAACRSEAQIYAAAWLKAVRKRATATYLVAVDIVLDACRRACCTASGETKV
jgi:hypothetical protein